MRIVFMGTSDFAVPALDALTKDKHELIAVITQPDRPAGRRQRLRPSPVKIYAQGSGLDVLQPERASAKPFVQQLRTLKPDMICVVAFGQILRRSVLDIPPCGCLNIHPSLLPHYRGAAPIQRAIIQGEKVTGVTIILLDEGEDTGDIVLQRTVPIAADDTSVTLSKRLAHIAAPLLLEAIALAEGEPPPHTPQNHACATYAPKLSKEEAVIDWNQSAEVIHNRIRGLQPWPGAITSLPDGMSLKLLSSCVGSLPGELCIPPGTLHITVERELWVQTGNGGIQLHQVQPASKRPMSARDFINGYRITTGIQFGQVH